MRFTAKSLMILPVLLGAAFAHAQVVPPAPIFPPNINHVVVIFQENRTPDNLFHDLAGLTGLGGIAYNIQTTDPTGAPLQPVGMATNFDLDHSNGGFLKENQSPEPALTPGCGKDIFGCAASTWNQFMFVDNRVPIHYNNSYGQGTTHVLDPYLAFAQQYGWANFMYQTNQGPSYPAHQFIFGGTSGDGDSASTFVSENFGTAAGCLAPNNAGNSQISPSLTCTAGCSCRTLNGVVVQECPVFNKLVFPNPVGSFCYNHSTMATLLDFPPPPKSSISWKYYAPSAGSIWTAPDSIKSICQPAFSNPNDPNSPLVCTGTEWNANVDLEPSDVLGDITNCRLSGVSWVIPDGRWSDHANLDHGLGSSWVAAIINAIGTNPQCPTGTKDAGEILWNNTAIIITWDDWGGWFDHEPPVVLPCTSTSNCQGDYQYGFRVPLVVVSAYTPQGYINNIKPHDFGSILRMIEGIYSLGEGSLGSADARASGDLRQFFTLTTPRPYTVVPAVKDASFFLSVTGTPVGPDDN
jgi:phospholipase C